MNDHIKSHTISAKTDKNNYTFTNFEVQAYATDGVHSYDPTTLSRYRNIIVKAFQKFNRLPRLIVVIFEDDIVQAIDKAEQGISQAYEVLLSWLVKEHHRSVMTIKERLPTKALRQGWPHILYMAPTIHKYYRNDNLRKSFTRALESVARRNRNFENMSTLRLWNYWDKDDSRLYNKERNYITHDGISTFWQALHSSIKHCIQKLDEQFTQAIIAENNQANSSHREMPYDHTYESYQPYEHHWQNQPEQRRLKHPYHVRKQLDFK